MKTCEMLVASGRNSDVQWFDWRSSYSSPIIRVEWDLDTMLIEVPDEIADVLIRLGYAHPVADVETREKTDDPGSATVV